MLSQLVSILAGWLTSVWTMSRLIFVGLNTDTMISCAQLLAVVFIIGVVDNLPNFFKRRPKTDPELIKHVQALIELESARAGS